MALTITIPGAVEATIGATAPAILTVGVGVPGATGATGATGAQGPQGDPGEGVPVGGSAGQVLAKIDGTNYNTEWVNVEGDYLPLAGGTMTGTLYVPTIGNILNTNLVIDAYNDTGAGTHNYFNFNPYGGGFELPSGSAGITFGNASVQTIAFPGFNNAALTGNPTAPTPSVGDNDTSIATTAFVKSQNYLYAPTISWSYGAAEIDDTVTGLSVLTTFDNFLFSASTTSYADDGYGAAIVSESGSFNLTKSGFSLYRYPLYNGQNPSSATVGGELNYDSETAVLTLRAFTTAPVADNTITIAPTGVTLPNAGSITFGDATVQTTAAVTPDLSPYALLASPVFTGNPTAPTATFGDSDTSIATTAFVQAALAGGTAIARNLEVQVRNQSGSTIPAGSIVYISGATGNLPLITLAQADNDANSAQTMGFTAAAIANNASGYVIVRGECENLNTSALTEGVQLYLSPTVAGAYTTTKPAAPQHLVYVGIVIRAHPTLGTILVAVQNGYELNELHDVSLTTPANNDLLAYETSTDLWKNKTAATLGLAAINSQAFTGTPSLPTGTTGVTQSINDNSTKLITTAGLRDNLSDGTWSVPPITTTTTATSGTGAVYVNASPDFGYLVGPNVNLAGFCQKNFQMFARSNSTYGFNYTKEMRIACKMAIAWTNSFTGITYTLIQRLGNSGNGALGVVGFGISINMATKVLSIVAHNGTTLTTKATSWVAPTTGIASIDFMVKSDGTGTVSAYADGVFIDSTTGMSTATTSTNTSMLAAVEINSVGTTSTANATGFVCNLRSFVAHG